MDLHYNAVVAMNSYGPGGVLNKIMQAADQGYDAVAIGCFLDKNAPPSPDEIETALGPRYPLWLKITRFIETNYQMPAALTYGGTKFGWNLWYRKSGKSLVSLFPAR
jgi:hypothetical protein